VFPLRGIRPGSEKEPTDLLLSVEPSNIK
jgi:hypothetical protein